MLHIDHAHAEQDDRDGSQPFVVHYEYQRRIGQPFATVDRGSDNETIVFRDVDPEVRVQHINVESGIGESFTDARSNLGG